MQNRLPISDAARAERIKQIAEFGSETLDRLFQTWTCTDCVNRFETGGLAAFVLSRPTKAVASAHDLKTWIIGSTASDTMTCPVCDGENCDALTTVLVCYSVESNVDLCFEFSYVEESDKWLASVVAIKPNNETNRLSLADPSLKQSYHDLMLRHVAIVLEIDGKSAAALELLNDVELELGISRRSTILRGTIHRELGEYDQAVRSFQRLLDESAPQDVLYEIGLTHFAAVQAGHDALVEAFAVFRGLTDLYPDFASGHLYMGNVLLGLGEESDALASFLRATELDRDMLAAHFNVALVELNRGEFTRALSFLERAEAIAPNDIEVLARLRLCYQALNDADNVSRVELRLASIMESSRDHQSH